MSPKPNRRKGLPWTLRPPSEGGECWDIPASANALRAPTRWPRHVTPRKNCRGFHRSLVRTKASSTQRSKKRDNKHQQLLSLSEGLPPIRRRSPLATQFTDVSMCPNGFRKPQVSSRRTSLVCNLVLHGIARRLSHHALNPKP